MALLQYVFDGAEKEVKVKPHGNAKNSKPYYRTSELTKNRQEELAKKHPPKQAFHKSLEESGGILQLRASLCKILISSFAHKMDFANNFSVDFF